jgi:hypothetical protein
MEQHSFHTWLGFLIEGKVTHNFFIEHDFILIVQKTFYLHDTTVPTRLVDVNSLQGQ